MVDILDSALAIIVYALALANVALGAARGCVRRYLYVNLYLLALLAADALRHVSRRAYGFTSLEYFYVYYLSDALLAVFTYLLILGFFDILFRDSPLRVQVRLALLIFFGLVAGMSYVFVSHSVSHFYSRLLVEFQQNMYFAGLLLTVLLWVSLLHLRIADRQLSLLITGVGILVATQASGYALQNLLPRELFLALSGATRHIPPLATVAMLGVWCYAFVQAPEKAARAAEAGKTTGDLAHSAELKPALSEAEGRG